MHNHLSYDFSCFLWALTEPVLKSLYQLDVFIKNIILGDTGPDIPCVCLCWSYVIATEADHTLLCSEFVLAYIIINGSCVSLHLTLIFEFLWG